MNLNYNENDLNNFINNIYFDGISSNRGGMKTPDCFSLYFILKCINPETVIECGCFNNISTKVIQKTIKDVNIILSDPIEHKLEDFKGIDYSGKKFVDFKNIDLSMIKKETCLVIFDDHQNAAQRLIQCHEKGIKHILFNDNYPVNCGSHFSLEHLKNNDSRDIFNLNTQKKYSINKLEQIDLSKKDELLSLIKTYHIFPNIYKSKINLMEGIFDSDGYFDSYIEKEHIKYKKFWDEKNTYTWNTYVELY